MTLFRGSLFGLAVAMAFSAMGGSRAFPINAKPRRKPGLKTHPALNDLGPVIDSTPESKRARRRRLAKANHLKTRVRS